MAIDPFQPAVSPSLNRDDADLNKGMATLSNFPDFFTMCAALVDLTDGPTAPPYVGLNDSEMLYVGSLEKISAMYTAFELRSRVRMHVNRAIDDGLSTTTPGWEKAIIKELEGAWKPALHAIFSDLPGGLPDLTKIFAFSTDGDVDFAASSRQLSDAEIDQIGEHGNPQGMFLDWMRSMLRWSNNAAASKCILALGYPYINGALISAGFMDGSRQNGLWLSGDYLGHDWIPNPPNQPQANRAGRPLSPRWDIAQGRHVSNFTATAFQVAALMTLLATDQLVDQAASQEMRDLMTGSLGIGSYAKHGLRVDGRTTTSSSQRSAMVTMPAATIARSSSERSRVSGFATSSLASDQGPAIVEISNGSSFSSTSSSSPGTCSVRS